MTVDIKTIVEPTFRTTPEDACKLYPTKAKLIADEILCEKLENKSADDVEFEFEELSKSIADEVKEKIKASMHIPRYKVLVQATIGTMKDQGVKITSRCLWDTSTDNYATASFQNEFIFASVLVFFLYTD
ncbi:dynein light chain [Skeletonema marinoi]|uniref:Dynein light chain n=1 Tax=Skeletonema marinoi TaxID=267567 RepID=A0AAD9DC98_9STRA|nr:dynein light chain [Skeletonema marinoi]